MTHKTLLAAGLVLLVQAQAALAFTPNTTPLTSREKNIEPLGTAVATALPVGAAGIALYKHDRKGLGRLRLETGLTVGTAFALKNIVREQRPNGTDYQSFPSDTTALAASGSSFLWRRYGWEYGLPSAALTEFVAYSRIQARQHRWYDTLTSSAIAAGYGMMVVPRLERYYIHTELTPAPVGGIIRMSYRW